MSLLSENIIPGNHGKIFGTDMEENDLIEIKTSLLTLEGINEVILNTEIFRGNLHIYGPDCFIRILNTR
jgi:hypothetical protein